MDHNGPTTHTSSIGKKTGRRQRQQRRLRSQRMGMAVLLALLSFWTTSRVMTSQKSIIPDSLGDGPDVGNHSTINDRQPPPLSLSKSSSSSSSMIPRHHNFNFDFPLCLVHIGKTAGSSISCGLGLQYADCEGMPREALPYTGYIHMRKNTCRVSGGKGVRGGGGSRDEENRIATFLITVRNPLTRIQSWFEFEKNIVPTRKNKRVEKQLRWKRGLLFVDCYRDFDAFITEGLRPLPTTTTTMIQSEKVSDMNCPERAWAAVLGARDFSYHEFYNYEHYHTTVHEQPSVMKNESTLLVLRTEHLAEDWSQLSKEPLFRQVNRRGTRANVVPSLSSNTTIVASSTTPVQQLDWTNLCRALCPEIQIYKRILYEGRNLDAAQVRTSIDEVLAICPAETVAIRTCPTSSLPTFPLMKVPRRQYQSETKKRLFEIA